MSILLINPPTAKICEPPAGIARLAGALHDHGIECWTADLNLECMLDMINAETIQFDTWSRRSSKNRSTHLAELRATELYNNPDRYRRAVKDINRLLTANRDSSKQTISLTDYSDHKLSPLISSDLLRSAEQYMSNPFFSSFSNHIDNLLANHSPRYVGISFSYLSQALVGFAMIGHIRKRYPSIIIVAGGSLMTSWMSGNGWSNPFKGLIDILVKGPGEKKLLELMNITVSESFGRPDYSGFQFSKYLAPGPVLPYAASDGCYWNKCSFCPDKAENNQFRSNSPERVSEELSQLITRHRPVLLHFLDNAIPPAVMRKMTASPPGVPWYGFARIEKHLEDIDFCQDLRNSGCIMLKLGLESGSQRVLDRMEKGIELARVSKVLKNLDKAGIATYIYLLFGTPFENEKEAELTLNYIEKNHRYISFLNLAIFNMPVCSPEAATIADRFSDGDLSLYCNFIHPSGWDRKSIRNFLQNRFKKNKYIGKIIQRDPLFFTSNHAPLLYLNS